MSAAEELVHDLIDLHVASLDGDRARVRKVEARVRDRVQESLEAMRRGELVPATVPDIFGPDD